MAYKTGAGEKHGKRLLVKYGVSVYRGGDEFDPKDYRVRGARHVGDSCPLKTN
jgi:hypothetical protein